MSLLSVPQPLVQAWLAFHQENGVLLPVSILLNRPKRHSALSDELMHKNASKHVNLERN